MLTYKRKKFWLKLKDKKNCKNKNIMVIIFTMTKLSIFK